MPASSIVHPEAVPSQRGTLSASGPPQSQETQERPVTADDVNFVMDICARVEAESKICHRMALRNLKKRRNHSGNLSRTFDIEADLENSLHLVECLPQGSRGADPPSEEFMRLSRAVLGADASPRRILENALLFEEYALQLLSENDSQYESQHNRSTASSWLIFSDVEQRIPAESQVALSWPDKWLARRICRLLQAAPLPERQNGVRHRSAQPEVQRNRHRRRPRKRRRKEAAHQDSDDKSRDKEDVCESYSSDNYSDTSDEDEGKGQIDNAIGQD